MDRVINEKITTITELRQSIEKRQAQLVDNGSQEVAPSAPAPSSSSAYNDTALYYGQCADITDMAETSRARSKQR